MSHSAKVDGRSYGNLHRRRFIPELAEWSRPNIDLARHFGVSRERVRFLRDRLGLPKVESRGRKPNKK